jgi:chromosome segregation ATPase
MLKKVAIVGAAGLLAATVLSNTKIGSYACSWVDRAEKRIESSIPPEEEVRRIKSEVNKLEKDIDRAKGSLAEEVVEVRYLKGKVEDLRVQVDKSRSMVEMRAKMLKENTDTKLVKWDGREISYTRGKELLANEVKAFKHLETEFKAEETKMATHQRTRDLAEQLLQSLVSQKAEMEAAVTELEAAIKIARIEQVESKYQNDGTRMAEIKESIKALHKRLDVQREKLSLSKKIDGRSSVENKSVDEIMADLNSPRSDTVGKK